MHPTFRGCRRRVKAQVLERLCSGQHRKDGKSLSTTLEQIAIVKSMIAHYPETFELALDDR